MAANERWGLGSQRIAKAQLTKMLVWAAHKRRRMIPANPLRGLKHGKGRARLTYLTDEQEEKFLNTSKPYLALAIKVLIRTGAQPSEFCHLERRHIEFSDDGMTWTFQPHESKNNELREIKVADREIIAIVKEQLAKHPTGRVFRKRNGEAWSSATLGKAFQRVRDLLRKRGLELDNDCCLYTCRHTFAKRILSGHWNKRYATLEHLANLMGNTEEVCRKYAAWSKQYQEPLWELVGDSPASDQIRGQHADLAINEVSLSASV